MTRKRRRLTVVLLGGLALATSAALVLAALSRLPETASNTSGEGLTLYKVLSSFSEMLRRHSFLGYQMAGSFSFAALFVYLSTVAFFLPDVFNISTSLFGYAFALTVFGFMTGSLINARLVIRFGMNQTLKAGLTISLLSAAQCSCPPRPATTSMPWRHCPRFFSWA